LSSAKNLSAISSPVLSGEKKVELKKETSEVGMHVVRNEVLPGSSKLNFRPLQLKSSLVVKEGAVSNIEATKAAAPARTSQSEDINSNSTITILRPCEPSENMTPVETLEFLKDVLLSRNAGDKSPVIRVVTGSRGKVPISRLRSSLSSKGHVQLLSTPSQCQELLLSLAGSGRLQTLMPSVQENKQIPSIGGTQGKENTLDDTVRKLTPDVPTTSSVEVQKVVNSSAREIQETLVSAGKLAVSQGEQQSVNSGHMKVAVSRGEQQSVNPGHMKVTVHAQTHMRTQFLEAHLDNFQEFFHLQQQETFSCCSFRCPVVILVRCIHCKYLLWQVHPIVIYQYYCHHLRQFSHR
jgi:hypothetical protein